MIDEPLFKVALSIFLACLPALFWGYIFYKKQPETRYDLSRIFIAGAISVAPLLAYKYLWQFFPWINAFAYANAFSADVISISSVATVPVSVILTFMIVGIIEEVAKYFAVVNIHNKRMCSITDCMEYFIIAGLGFAFIENIIYFYNIMSIHGAENILLPFILRSLFSTFAHLMFSGILGYYYGLAFFATDVLKEQHYAKSWTVIRSISKLLGIKKEILFHHERIIQGFFLAILLHAVFNILLELNWTFLIVPYLTAGFIILSAMFDNRHIDKSYCQLEN